MEKCNRCRKEAHHTHHKNHNHNDNRLENLERLCTFCHAKEHKIEPKFSELKKLIVYYEKVQKMRVAIRNSLMSFKRIELDPPKGLVDEAEKLRKLEHNFEKEIKNYWEENPTPLYEWAIKIKGVGGVSIAKILSQIDFKRTPGVSSLWAYAGFTPESNKRKGVKANWNGYLKSYCFQLVDCMIKARTPKYRDVYDREKEKQLVKGLKKRHSHNRALRKVAKVFLRDLYLVGVDK